eukprot:gnl/TRDRNA2_/TRDRNA2_161767_c1_seq2.p1 gnl/TRDRNA2_/TRDRNA2_161767_c1~~gnl/TRDRNA2_/TRDRNA2_161767_c1_seq2.p1  ORF type:complete len:123 (-),score=21.07 gnl/TRDRNA2_/TRDRNA2_161767_c1_seq2:65-433(-)
MVFGIHRIHGGIDNFIGSLSNTVRVDKVDGTLNAMQGATCIAAHEPADMSCFCQGQKKKKAKQTPTSLPPTKPPRVSCYGKPPPVTSYGPTVASALSNNAKLYACTKKALVCTNRSMGYVFC